MPKHLNQTAGFCSNFTDVQWYCYVLFGLYVVALPLGILGNIATLVNFTCLRKARTTSSILLLNLALCDLAWILTLPFTIYFNIQKLSLRDVQTFCKAKNISFNINIYGSIIFLTFVSFDRYAGTVHPIRSLKWWDAGKAKLCCICTWVLLFISCLPDIFFTFVAKRSGDVTLCLDHAKTPSVYVRTSFITRTLVGFLLPFVVMLTFYTMTIKVLRNLPKSRAVGQRSGKPLLLLSAAIVVFVVSFVPYHVMVVTLVLMRAKKDVEAGNVLVLYVCYEFCEAACSLSSCLDPLLYILASERFLKGWLTPARRRCVRGCCRRTRRVGVEARASGPGLNARADLVLVPMTG
ncbi:P2Y purinoceptor 1-like [Scleropages formosus]|uniref:p2Y purinoceptor 1-like n=1 Tax=Scleropages formosus TaxID=113540 RepID=A0A0P7UYZ4_SCLFO|nr:P2Y purinoceptor 1-like [Scleropages formosus]